MCFWMCLQIKRKSGPYFENILRFASVKIYHTQILYSKFVFKSKPSVFKLICFLEFLVKFQEKVYFCDKFLVKTSISNFEKQITQLRA